jgi:hypothetical protein
VRPQVRHHRTAIEAERALIVRPTRPSPRERRLRFLFVVFRVVFRGLLPMMGRMQSMRMRHVGVMAGFLVIAMFVMFGGLAVVMRSGFVMLGCGLVVAATFVLFRTHIALPSLQ